jgi:hypothetical protein
MEQAAYALGWIAGSKEHRGAVVAANAIPPLVQLLADGDARGKERAAAALRYIAASEEHVPALLVAGWTWA